jgi:hypothetical protein
MCAGIGRLPTIYRRQLEQAITGTAPDAPALPGLRRRLEEVLAEQQARADLTAAAGHAQT